MEVLLLGTVGTSGSITAGTPKQRCVLAVLAMSAGRTVPTESLIDRVWGDTPPAQVRSTLYSHIARLRPLLPAGTLTRESGGYALGVDPHRVDALRFRQLVDRARRANGDAERGALLREGLRLWRGVPLEGLSGEWAATVRDNLDQLRLTALVERIDLDLRAGTVPPAAG